jgi:hypothetical protein
MINNTYTSQLQVRSMNFKTLLLGTSLLIIALPTTAQTQKGADIDGVDYKNYSGYSVSMPDANTIAIGAYGNDRNGIDAGQVRIFDWNGTAWVQKGANIDGEEAYEELGRAVCMPDANTIAIGAPLKNANGINSGQVRIYSWTGTSWVQKGTDIDGEAPDDMSGYSVSMPDAITIAIGANGYNGNGANSGRVRIFTWSGTAWVQQGAAIDGEVPGEKSGSAICMPNANTIAIGAPGAYGNSSTAGVVRIYSWDGTSWVQTGADIEGEAVGDWSGGAVSMPDAKTIAIGAFLNDANGINSGHVRIYHWNGTAWVKKGIDIDGAADFDFFGYSVSMPDANTIAIGAYGNDGNGTDAGRVRVYNWNGTLNAWVWAGLDISGEAPGDQSGYSVSMPNANTIAIGAPYNKDAGKNAGHARIYSWSLGIEDEFVTIVNVYPNPCSKEVIIDLGNFNIMGSYNAKIVNALGQQVFQSIINEQEFVIDAKTLGSAGVYTLYITNENNKVVGVQKIVLQ